jgi:hypothetical protein
MQNERNKFRRKQIALISQSQFHVGVALDYFKQATSKRPGVVEKLTELMIDLDLEMEMIHEQME